MRKTKTSKRSTAPKGFFRIDRKANAATATPDLAIRSLGTEDLAAATGAGRLTDSA